jgi:hypothetical protein
MEKRPPRFHRRPRDPGIDDRLVAFAVSTLVYDVKERVEKTLQRKNEILPPKPQQQQQQWYLPNRTTGSSSNNNNNRQYSSNDSDDDGEEMVVFFYGEDSGNGGSDAPTDSTSANDSKTNLTSSILTDSNEHDDYNTYNDSEDSIYVPNSTFNKMYNEISDNDDNSGILGSSGSSMDIAKELLCEENDSEEDDSGSNGDGCSDSDSDSECSSDGDSDGSSDFESESEYDEDDLTDLGVGSCLIMEYINTKLSSEPDYELFASNDSSTGFAEVFGKFMDQYETKFNDDGKLIEGFNLFDQD